MPLPPKVLDAHPPVATADGSRKPYITPRLVEIGKLGSLTLGKSGPGTDSNNRRQTTAP